VERQVFCQSPGRHWRTGRESPDYAANIHRPALTPYATRVRLSVIVITKNEEAAIGRCLASVTWADELIVVDSGSTDRTCDIARERGARVEITPDWPGFGAQKNRALDLATGDWVLSIDADEWVDDALRVAIRQAIVAPGEHSAFEVSRLSSYCGRYIRHSGWWPDLIVRLFKRGNARFSPALAHETLETTGSVGRIGGTLMHESFLDFEDVIDKMDRYSTLSARMLHERGRRAGLGTAVVHGLWAFIRTYFLRAGFLDGRQGFMLAVSNAEGAYYRYVKLWLLIERERAQP